MLEVTKDAVYKRIKRGMTKEQAMTMPPRWERKLTKEKVLDVERHLISINAGAYVLGVGVPTLWAFLNRHGIEWRGKRANTKKGEVNPNSFNQKCIALGFKPTTIAKRMRVKGISFGEAVSYGLEKRGLK